MKEVDVAKAYAAMNSVNHPVRRAIMSILENGPERPANISKKLGRLPQRVLYHLWLLEKAKVVGKSDEVRNGRGKLVLYHIEKRKWTRLKRAVELLSRA